MTQKEMLERLVNFLNSPDPKQFASEHTIEILLSVAGLAIGAMRLAEEMDMRVRMSEIHATYRRQVKERISSAERGGGGH